MSKKIYLVEYFDGCEWDTDHARLSPERVAQFPLTNQEGEIDARLLKAWTDEEYIKAFGREFVEFSDAWEPAPLTPEQQAIVDEWRAQPY